MRHTLLTTIAMLAISGCLSNEPSEGVLACASAAECPSGWSCRDDRCWRTPGGGDAGLDGGGSDAGLDAGDLADAGPDAAGDAGHDASDGGPILCNPIAQTGCDVGERCAWVRTTDDAGELRCVVPGTGDEDDACSFGPTGDTGYDDCRSGLVCIGERCATVCDTDAPASCGDEAYCIPYDGLFGPDHDGAACRPRCDPLQRSPALTCPVGTGCYEAAGIDGSTFTCVTVSSRAGVVGAPPASNVEGQPYLNGCVPGARPLLGRDGSYYCSAYCLPLETHTGSTSGAGGASPFRCQDRGGGSTDACIFNWALVDPIVYDPFQNTLGTCLPVDRAFLYDHDADATTPDEPAPSCPLLPNADTDGDGAPQHLEVGCAPLPAP